MRGFERSTATGRQWRNGLRGIGAACAILSGIVLSPQYSDGFIGAAEAGEDAPIVTYTGLQVHEDGSSTVFVDLTRTTKVEAKEGGKEVSFLLSGAKIRTRNNKNPLIAEYFKTNLLRAKLVDDAGGVRLIVSLREAVKTEHGMTDSGQGARLRVNIPAPTSP